MSVIIEAYSIIIQTREIEAKWPGGWIQFNMDVPNRTLCTDGNLARVGFMKYDDAMEYCQLLEEQGIVETNEERADGYVVISQVEGPHTEAAWFEFGHINKDCDPKMKVAVCRLTGDGETPMAYPDWWKFEGSLSDKPNFVRNEEAEQRLERIRRRDGLEIYYDKKTRKQVFVGRTGNDKKK